MKHVIFEATGVLCVFFSTFRICNNKLTNSMLFILVETAIKDVVSSVGLAHRLDGGTRAVALASKEGTVIQIVGTIVLSISIMLEPIDYPSFILVAIFLIDCDEIGDVVVSGLHLLLKEIGDVLWSTLTKVLVALGVPALEVHGLEVLDDELCGELRLEGEGGLF